MSHVSCTVSIPMTDEMQHGNEMPRTNHEQLDSLVISSTTVDAKGNGQTRVNEPEVVPQEGSINTSTATPTTLAASLDIANREVSTREIAVFKHWQEGKYSAALQQALGIAKAYEDLASISDELAQVKAKTAAQAKDLAAKGYNGKPRGELNVKSSVTSCQGECGNKLSAFGGKPKRCCKGCGLVVCEDCSPPPKVNVVGYSEPQRVCIKCTQAQELKLQELEAAATDAAKQCATAREIAQQFRADELGTAENLDGDNTAALLEKGLSIALAEGDLKRAAFLKQKLEKVRDLNGQRVKLQGEQMIVRKDLDVSRCNDLEAELKALPTATLFVVIALEAFPVGMIVCASVASANGVAAGKAGEVVGHTPKGEVEVRFKEGSEAFAVASLHAADLTNGWIVHQTCFSLAQIPNEVVLGQPGRIIGWSKPFDRDKLMVEFDGHQVNVLLSQIETPEQFKEKSIQERKEAERALCRTIAKVQAQKNVLEKRLEVARAADPDAAAAATMQVFAAARDGNVALVEKCVAACANVDGNRDDDGNTALIVASIVGHSTVIQLLLDGGADPEAKDKYDRTALIYASRYGHTAIVKLLLEADAEKDASDKYGVTALTFASEHSRTAVVELLLLAGVNKETRTLGGNTALIVASFKNCVAIVDLLLQAGANKEAKDKDGMSALDWARDRGHTEVMALLDS